MSLDRLYPSSTERERPSDELIPMTAVKRKEFLRRSGDIREYTENIRRRPEKNFRKTFVRIEMSREIGERKENAERKSDGSRSGII